MQNNLDRNLPPFTKLYLYHTNLYHTQNYIIELTIKCKTTKLETNSRKSRWP